MSGGSSSKADPLSSASKVKSEKTIFSIGGSTAQQKSFGCVGRHRAYDLLLKWNFSQLLMASDIRYPLLLIHFVEVL